MRRLVARSPKLAAVDEAIGAEGWKIVALLRLSPAVPFNLQNYLYGVTAVGFWPAVGASWLAMLPGTFMYVYLGSIGRTAAAGATTSPAEWALRAVGERGLGLPPTVTATEAYAAEADGPTFDRAMDASSPRALRWLDYDWRLNSRQHHTERETR